MGGRRLYPWPAVAVALLAVCPTAQGADAGIRFSRHLDLRPPEIAMDVEPTLVHGEFLVRARVTDRSGISKVLVGVDGDIVGARIHGPFAFRVQLENLPAEVCVVADDVFGNSGKACRPVGHVCLINGDCEADELCRLPVGACFGDFEGVCQQRPTACTDEVEPVCGCDGQEYTNFCEALAAGVNVAVDGPCPE